MLTTWNPADLSANEALSNGNLTCTYTTNNFSNGGVRSTTSKAAGKWYAEFAVGTLLSGGGAGVAEASAQLGGSTKYGAAQSSGTTVINGTGFSDGWANLANTTISVALDFTNKKLWFRQNGGNWNGSATDNPATNTGGHDISAWNPAALFLYYWNANVNDAATVNPGSSAFTYVVPSGFIAWDASAPVPQSKAALIC